MITKADLTAAQKACDDYTLTEADVAKMDAEEKDDAKMMEQDSTPAALPPVSPPPDGILSATAGVSTLAPVTDLSAGGSSMPTANVHPVAGVNLQDQCRSLIAQWRMTAKVFRKLGGLHAILNAELCEQHAGELERLLK